MRALLLVVLCVMFIQVVSMVSCKKDEQELNRAPLAKANTHITIQLNSCNDRTGSAKLDGSASVDPDSNIVRYLWQYVSGLPNGFVLRNANTPIATLDNILPGKYSFELTVTDKKGLSSKILVDVEAILKLHDMDLSANGNYNFSDNFHYTDSWYYYYDYYSDFTDLSGIGNSDSLGEFQFQLQEYSDTADLVYYPLSTITIYQNSINYVFASGNCSISFKKLIQTGGGAFSGTVTLTDGSAGVCNGSFLNLPPLSISGNLDTASKKVNLQLKGKMFL